MNVAVRYRPTSAAERLAVGGAALVPVALVYPAVHAATGLRPFCPLRTVTGIPCPLCGGTTSATALVAGRLDDALAVNPLVPVLAVGLAGILVLMAARALGWAARPQPWSAARRRWLTGAAAAALLVSWVVQLHRFDLL